MVQQVPRSSLTAHHEALVCALDANFNHQHSRIRHACLVGLRPLVDKVRHALTVILVMMLSAFTAVWELQSIDRTPH